MLSKLTATEFIDVGMREIAWTIKNDYTMTEEEKEKALAKAMDKAGVKCADGHYYIPTGVWDD